MCVQGHLGPAERASRYMAEPPSWCGSAAPGRRVVSGPPTLHQAPRQAVGVAVGPTPWQLSVGVPALPLLVPTSAPQVPSPDLPLSHQVRRCQVPCQLEIKCAWTQVRAHPTSPPRLHPLSPWGPQVHSEGWGGGLPPKQTSLFWPEGWGWAAADPGWAWSMSRPGGQTWLGGLGWASRAVSTVSLHGAPTTVAGRGTARTGALGTQGVRQGQTPTLSSETSGAPLEERQGWAPRGWMGDPGPQAQDGRRPLSGACDLLALRVGSCSSEYAHLLTFKDRPGGRAGAGRRAPVPLLHTPGAALVEVAPTG